MCDVAGMVSVPREAMRHMSVGGLGSAITWSRQGRGRYYGQVGEFRDEEEGRGRKNYGADGILHVLLPNDCPLQKGRGARRLVILMPGGVEYLTRIKTFTVSFLLQISSLIWTLSHTRESPLSVKTLGLACASCDSAVTVSHSLLRNPCSSVSLQGMHNAGMPHPACFAQRPEPYCCLLTSPVCLAALGLPSHGTYLFLSLLQVAKELLKEICEQMGVGEQEEIQEFVLFAIRSDSDNLGK